jgi:hypothetical protein
MNNHIAIINKLQASHDQDNLALQKIISGRLKRLGREKKSPLLASAIYWPAKFFGLNKSKLFVDATPHQQSQILQACSRDLLHEAYFIEKSGLAYCAKMVLLAETTETAQAYSLMGADEATHLQWISAYVSPSHRAQPEGMFLHFLTHLIEVGDANCLAYLLQVILEGWGLQHYQSLAADCLDPNLQSVLTDIVRDEALHQQAGTLLFQVKKLSDYQQNFLLDSLAHFLEMVRVGPEAVVSQVECVLGDLNAAEKKRLLEQIAGRESTAKKLKILRGLMLIPGCHYFVEKLDAHNLFQPSQHQ